MVFWHYVRNRYGESEYWVTPEHYNKLKNCRLLAARARRAADPAKHNRINLEWSHNRPERRREISRNSARKTYPKNRERILETKKQLAPFVREQTNARAKKYRESNPMVRIRSKTSVEIRRFMLKLGRINEKRVEAYIGCDADKFRRHMESLFKEGMTWGNYGKKGWTIDHKIPMGLAKSHEEVLKLSHFSNLRPLWNSENCATGKFKKYP